MRRRRDVSRQRCLNDRQARLSNERENQDNVYHNDLLLHVWTMVVGVYRSRIISFARRCRVLREETRASPDVILLFPSTHRLFWSSDKLVSNGGRSSPPTSATQERALV